MTGAPQPRTLPCPRCGALNGADFDRCIRCGAALSRLATSTDRLRQRIDARSLPATKLFGVLTMLVFAGQMLFELRQGGEKANLLMGATTSVLLRFGALPLVTEILRVEPWRLVSAIFVHIGLLHIVFNMFGLVYLGRLAEPAIGSARFAIAYVLTGVGGYLATMLLVALMGGGSLTAGASGSVFGMMGLVLGVLIRRRDPQWKDFLVRALILSLLLSFGLGTGMGVGVNNSAHVGGALSGVVFGVLFSDGDRRRSDLAVNLTAGVCVLVCVASLVLAQVSPIARQAAWWEMSRVDSPVIADAGSLV